MRTASLLHVFILFLLLFQSPASFGESTTSPAFLPVTPVCTPRGGYTHSIDTYCGQGDLDLKKPHHATTVILDSLNGESILVARLTIWAITDVTFAIALCDKLTARTKEFGVAVQRDTGSELVVEYLLDCARKKGVPKVSGRYGGLAVGGITSFHPKLVYLETESRRLGFIGSGNITRSRMNTDYFVRLPSKPISAGHQISPTVGLNYVDWIECVTQGLIDDGQKDTHEEIAQIREKCRLPSSDSEMMSFLMPTDSRKALLRMAFLAASYDEVSILTQGFNSNDITWILTQALLDGKKVRVLVDDDIFWAKEDPMEKLMNYAYEYEDHLAPLVSSGADARFLITNHNDIIGNYQHAKLYAFRSANNKSGVCIVGSANATSSAFRDNVETLIEVEGDLCVASQNWFDELWDRSVPAQMMPSKDPLR